MASAPSTVLLRRAGVARDYDVEVVAPKPATASPRLHRSPSWVDQEALRVRGTVITRVGLVLPTPVPESVTVLKVSARR